VHMQLAGNRADASFLDMIIAQDLRLQIGRDGHAVLLGEVWRRIEPVRRRRNSRRTNGGQRQPHQWQHQFPERCPGDGLATSPGEADGGLLAITTALAATKSSARCGGEP
jgi:hypothetical protein